VVLRRVPVHLLDRTAIARQYNAADAQGMAITVDYAHPSTWRRTDQASQVVLLHKVPEINAIQISHTKRGIFIVVKRERRIVLREAGFCEHLAFLALERLGGPQTATLQAAMVQP
jgi:hypothetical protein